MCLASTAIGIRNNTYTWLTEQYLYQDATNANTAAAGSGSSSSSGGGGGGGGGGGVETAAAEEEKEELPPPPSASGCRGPGVCVCVCVCVCRRGDIGVYEFVLVYMGTYGFISGKHTQTHIRGRYELGRRQRRAYTHTHTHTGAVIVIGKQQRQAADFILHPPHVSIVRSNIGVSMYM